MRVGLGYDIHRVNAECTLVLGGVTFQDCPGLEGHSDADVVFHAVADALLGAAGLGDIGDHFPDDSPRWKDADSAEILSTAVRAVRENGGLRPHNVDVNVLAERPRLSPQKDAMRRNIASLLDLPYGRVNVKARSAEGLGPVGHCRAIAAQAVVLLQQEKGQQPGSRS